MGAGCKKQDNSSAGSPENDLTKVGVSKSTGASVEKLDTLRRKYCEISNISTFAKKGSYTEEQKNWLINDCIEGQKEIETSWRQECTNDPQKLAKSNMKCASTESGWLSVFIENYEATLQFYGQ